MNCDPCQKLLDPAAIAACIAKRNNALRYGYSYPLIKGLGDGAGFGLDLAFADEIDLDESRMSAWIPFADGNRRDGVGDLLEVGGIDTSRHRKNPIVLFDHGKGHGEYANWPIAKNEDPETGEYTVFLDPALQVAKGNAFFYQGKGIAGADRGKEYNFAKVVEQLYDLLVNKYLRAGSIGYQVVAARELWADDNTGTPRGLHLLKTLMLEDSLVVLPANGDTTRKGLMPDINEVLCKGGMCCGRPLAPYLVKSLQPYAPARKVQLGYEGKSMGNKSTADFSTNSDPDASRHDYANPLSDQNVPPSTYKPGPGAKGQCKNLRKKYKSQPSDKISPEKARQILKDGEANGKPLTDKQRGMFGAAAGKDKSLPNANPYTCKICGHQTWNMRGKRQHKEATGHNSWTEDVAGKSLKIKAMGDYWAYGLDKASGVAVLIRCSSRDEAEMKKNTLKAGGMDKVGFTPRPAEEAAVRSYIQSQGASKVNVKALDTKGLTDHYDVRQELSTAAPYQVTRDRLGFWVYAVAYGNDEKEGPFNTRLEAERVCHEKNKTTPEEILRSEVGTGVQTLALGGDIVDAQPPLKNVKSLRLKYRKGHSHRIRRAGNPGAISMRIKAEHMAKCRAMAQEKGIEFKQVGEDKVRLTGDDAAMDELARAYGVREVKMDQSTAKKQGLEPVFSQNHQYGERIFYDPKEGKYYDAGRDMYLTLEETRPFGLKGIRIKSFAAGDRVRITDGGSSYNGRDGEVLRVSGDKIEVDVRGLGKPLTWMFEPHQLTKKSLTKALDGQEMSMAEKDAEALPEGGDIEVGGGDAGSGAEGQAGGQEEKYGAQVLRRLHEDARILLEEYDEFHGLLEDEDIKGHLRETLEHLVSMLEAREGLFDKKYKDDGYPPLEGAEESEAPDEDMVEEPKEEAMEEETEEKGAMDEEEAVEADSDEEMEPTGDEVIEGMNKKLDPVRTKALRAKHKAHTCTCQKSKPPMRTKGTDGLNPMLEASGKDPYPETPTQGQEREEMGIEGDHLPGNEAEDGSEMSMKSMSLASHHRKHIGGAAHYLKELAETDKWDEESQKKAYYFHKALGDTAQELGLGIEGDHQPGVEAGDGSGMQMKSDFPEMNAIDDEFEVQHKDGLGIEEGHEPGHEAEDGSEMSMKSQIPGDLDWLQEEGAESEHPIPAAAKFLGQLHKSNMLHDYHREKAWHLAKALEGLEADQQDQIDDVEVQESGVKDFPEMREEQNEVDLSNEGAATTIKGQRPVKTKGSWVGDVLAEGHVDKEKEKEKKALRQKALAERMQKSSATLNRLHKAVTDLTKLVRVDTRR